MSNHAASLHRVNDATPPFYLHAGTTKLFVTLQFNGGTVVLEHLGNEPATTEAGTWANDATYTTNQTRTQVTGTVGAMYRLRCSAAPSAGKGIQAILEANG